ncbi:MAG: DUF1501 domain-containing protein [Bdellovibrionales bacterium]
MKPSRRQILKALGSGMAWSLTHPLVPGVAFARSESNLSAADNLLFLIRVIGGWDVLMSTDARDFEALRGRGLSPSEFYYCNARQPLRQIEGALIGQALKPLVPYLQDVAIINGMMMIHDSPSHEVNRSYMASGSTENEREGFAPFQLARALAESGLAPRVSYRMGLEALYDGGYPRSIALESIRKLIEPSKTDDLQHTLENKARLDKRPGSLSRALDLAERDKMALELLPTLGREIRGRNLSDTQMDGINLSLAGLATGYAQMALCDFSVNLDTHDEHERQHLPELQRTMEAVAKTIATLKRTPFRGGKDPQKRMLWDVTTVVVMSEFSRSCWEQGGVGRDGTNHNQYDNSVILAGRGIQGGRVIGRSEIFTNAELNIIGAPSQLMAIPFDFKTNRALTTEEFHALTASGSIAKCRGTTGNCVDYIYPETLWRTLLPLFNVADIRSLGEGPVLSSLVKSL